MTRAIDAGELTKLRSDNQWARWHVIIDKPDVIYTARTTGPLEKTTAWTLGFDTGSGTLTNCLAGMTVLIGSSAGGWDRGIGRLRKNATGGDTVFYLGADPSIFCYDNDYITILNDFAPWSRHPIGANIDVDVAYSDQFSDFIPVPVFGERIAVIQAGDTIGFNAAASWVPGSTISGYAWTFTGATASADTTTATPTATYDNSGRFRVALTVTAANSKTATGYGWVYVLGDNLAPDAGVSIDDVEGETEIGWACRVVAYDRPTIKDRARVIVYSEDSFSGTAESLGPVTGRENIVMVGWIVGETIIREPGHDYVEFTVGGPGVFCGNIATMPAGLTDSALPTDDGVTLEAWAKMSGLTIARGLHYLLNYRTTLPVCIDVEVEDFDWPAHKLTADNETLWGQLETFANHGILTCTPDRYAHLYIQRDAALYPIVDRTADIPVVMTVTDGDWSDEVTANRRHSSEISMTEAEGTIYIQGYVFPLGGRSPGNVAGSFGVIENITEVNWPNSGTALEIAGMMAGRYSAEYESIGVVHPANNHFVDVAPRQYINVTIDSDTLRCIPRRVTLARDDAGQVAVELDLEPEGGQWSAVSIEYPGEGSPPVEPPEEPPVAPPPTTDPPEDPPEVSAADAIVVTADDVRVTADLDESSPTWTSIISGGPSAPVDSDLPETTNDILYVIEVSSIWKCTGVTGTPSWEEVWTGADLTGGTLGELTRIRVAPGTDSLVYVLGYGESEGENRPFVLRSSTGGSTWSESWIDDVLDENTPYTVTSGSGEAETPDNGATTTFDVNGAPVQIGDDPKGPWGFAISLVSGDNVTGAGYSDIGGVNAFGGSALVVGQTYSVKNNQLNSTQQTTVGDWFDDYFGVGNHNPASGLATMRTSGPTRVSFGGADFSKATLTAAVYVFWNYPDVEKPTALDVARTNNQYIYVGTSNKVFKSTDGGFTWAESLGDHGSNDIHVDPQLAGVYYHWATDGSLELVIADVVSGAALDTETPIEVGLRLARDLNSGRLWTLDSSATLRVRYNAVWSDLDTGLSGARGLHAYLGGKLIYLDGSAIMYSTDYGATQADKTGDWSGFGSPINAHLMRSE